MATWQSVIVFLLLILQIILFFKAHTQCKQGCSFSLVRWLSPLGMFVWGDVLILSVFWFVVSITVLLLQDWLLFLLIISCFWLVRSVGETIYWFLQQFASKKRDLPQSLMGYSFVKDESIWFIYQVFWQCLTVVTLISTVYLFVLWLL